MCLQATSRRSSRERRTLNLWLHSSVTAARPRPGETWEPSAEVRKQWVPQSPWGPLSHSGRGWVRRPLLHRLVESTRWQHSPSLRLQRLPCWWGAGVTAELLPRVIPHPLGIESQPVFFSAQLSPSRACQAAICLSSWECRAGAPESPRAWPSESSALPRPPSQVGNQG